MLQSETSRGKKYANNDSKYEHPYEFMAYKIVESI
jgi:hypothetical protein